MKIIAFGHAKSVGKDTAARFLLGHLRTTRPSLKVVKAGFADKVKDVAFDLYRSVGLQPGSCYELAENRHLKELPLPTIGKSPRQLWIEVGNNLRQVYEATWFDYLLFHTKANVLLVSDLRYPFEADQILEHGGYLFKIHRPSVQHTSDAADDALLSYNRWTDTIANDGILADLYDKIVSLAEQYL